MNTQAPQGYSLSGYDCEDCHKHFKTLTSDGKCPWCNWGGWIPCYSLDLDNNEHKFISQTLMQPHEYAYEPVGNLGNRYKLLVRKHDHSQIAIARIECSQEEMDILVSDLNYETRHTELYSFYINAKVNGVIKIKAKSREEALEQLQEEKYVLISESLVDIDSNDSCTIWQLGINNKPIEESTEETL